MIEQTDYVYCTQCKHFIVDDTETPKCPFEDKCYLWDCEDGRVFSLRRFYEDGKEDL